MSHLLTIEKAGTFLVGVIGVVIALLLITIAGGGSVAPVRIVGC